MVKLSEQHYSQGRYTPAKMLIPEISKFLPTQPMWVQNTLTKEWDKAVIKSQVGLKDPILCKHHKEEKRKNRLHLREAGIPTNAVPKALDVKKVSQPVVQSVPKGNVQSVLRSTMKLVPKANVQSVSS